MAFHTPGLWHVDRPTEAGKSTWPDTGAMAASGHAGAGVCRGSAGWAAWALSSRQLTLHPGTRPACPAALHESSPLPAPDTRGRRSVRRGVLESPALTPLSALPSGQCHRLAGPGWTLSVPGPPPASLCEAPGRLALSSAEPVVRVQTICPPPNPDPGIPYEVGVTLGGPPGLDAVTSSSLIAGGLQSLSAAWVAHVGSVLFVRGGFFYFRIKPNGEGEKWMSELLINMHW